MIKQTIKNIDSADYDAIYDDLMSNYKQIEKLLVKEKQIIERINIFNNMLETSFYFFQIRVKNKNIINYFEEEELIYFIEMLRKRLVKIQDEIIKYKISKEEVAKI